jgi:hypothetical protein
MKKSEIKHRGHIRIGPNRNGGVDGYLNGALVISIWDDRVHFSAPIWGGLGAATSILECQRKVIEWYQKHQTPSE